MPGSGAGPFFFSKTELACYGAWGFPDRLCFWNNSGSEFMHLEGSQCAFRAPGVTMVSHCSNPACTETFKYLGEGKLFLDNPTAGLQMSQQQLFEQCYWLCKECSMQYRLAFERGLPHLVPLVLKKAANL